MLRPSSPPLAPPGPEPRRERNAQATQQRLLDAAEREFAARGYAGSRLRDIADGAGVQPALIHHYFGDKHGLYRAVFDRAMQLTSGASQKVLETRNDLEGLIAGLVDVLVDFYSEHQHFLAIVRHESLLGPTTAAIEIIRDRSMPVIDAVVALLEERQKSGEIRPDVDPREMVLAGLSMAVHPFSEQGMVEALMPDCVPHDADALARRKRTIVALLLGGIRGGS